MTAVLLRLGFEPARLRFCLRTALAACIALLLAWLLGLEHPQWSAMTVWAASQPGRGQLAEKAFFRFAGTLSGVAAGMLIMVVSHGQPALLVLGLALWTSLCAGIGNIQRGFVSYGTMLAGYSAAMVALLDTAHPDHVFALGADRLATISVGVAVALVVGWLLTPAAGEDALAGRIRRLLAGIVRAMADRLDTGAATDPRKVEADLSEMAAIDEALDPHGAGSLRSRRAARSLRVVLASAVSALIWLRSQRRGAADGASAAALRRAADALETAADPQLALAELTQASMSVDDPALRDVLERLAAALAAHFATPEQDEAPPRTHFPVALHRDWVGAREATIRSFLVMLAVGAVWIATGWHAGPFVLLGVAIMTSLFSTFDDPAATMRFIFLGQIVGAAGALACRWIVWPHAQGELELVLMMMPFILVGAPLLAHPRTAPIGFDYNMVMLLLLVPHFPLTGTPGQSLATAAAVALAPLVALAAYRFVFPAGARRRMDTLIAMMVREIEAMAADARLPADRALWRARLYHRLLRLVRWAEKTGSERGPAVEGGLAVLRLGTAAISLHALRGEDGLPPGTSRSLSAALERLSRLRAAPDKAGAALERAARRIGASRPEEAETLQAAAIGLARNLPFFRRAASL